MKNLFLLLAVVFFFPGCNTSDSDLQEKLEQTPLQSYIAGAGLQVWKLVELETNTTESAKATNTSWTSIEDCYVLAINRYDGTFNITKYSKLYPECTTGTTMITRLFTLKFDCTNSGFEPIREYEYKYKNEGKTLELKPLDCANCRERLTKVYG